MKRARAAVGLTVAAGLAAAVGVHLWRARGVSLVQRGQDLAAARGCVACHGPGGLRGFEDATRAALGDVPTFTREAVESYARDEGEIREWILDGMPRRLRETMTGETADEPRRLFVMPAFRGRLASREVDQLVAYIVAASGFHAAEDGPIGAGLEAGERLGCFTCHGPQGRGTPPNPRSLAGYIPAWDGPDFNDLARDEGEVREWILDGSPRRLRENPLARYFLGRQSVQMPAYRGHIAEADTTKLVDYIRALRRSAGRD